MLRSEATTGLDPRRWTALILLCVTGFMVILDIVESRSAAPLVPLRIFRSRLLGGNLAMVLFAMTALGMSITVSAYAQRVLGYTPMRFGLGRTEGDDGGIPGRFHRRPRHRSGRLVRGTAHQGEE